MWQLVFASRHRLIPQEEDAKRVPDGHGRSFGSWPWQKRCSVVRSLATGPSLSSQNPNNKS